MYIYRERQGERLRQRQPGRRICRDTDKERETDKEEDR